MKMGIFGKNEEQVKPAKIWDAVIDAGDVVKNSKFDVNNIPGKYTIIRDDVRVTNEMVRALNIMAAAGWKCVNAYGGEHTFVLMEKV